MTTDNCQIKYRHYVLTTVDVFLIVLKVSLCVCFFCTLNSSVCSYVNAKFIRHRRLHCDLEIRGFRCRLFYIFDVLGCCAASVASYRRIGTTDR